MLLVGHDTRPRMSCGNSFVLESPSMCSINERSSRSRNMRHVVIDGLQTKYTLAVRMFVVGDQDKGGNVIFLLVQRLDISFICFSAGAELEASTTTNPIHGFKKSTVWAIALQSVGPSTCQKRQTLHKCNGYTFFPCNMYNNVVTECRHFKLNRWVRRRTVYIQWCVFGCYYQLACSQSSSSFNCSQTPTS